MSMSKDVLMEDLNLQCVVGLNRLGIGRRARVVKVQGPDEIRRRLLEMGLCKGVTVEAVRRAPLGDPIEFRVRGYFLSLRDEQAQHAHVVPLE